MNACSSVWPFFTPARRTQLSSDMSVMPVSRSAAPPEDFAAPAGQVADAVLGLRDGLSSKPKPQAPSPSSKP